MDNNVVLLIHPALGGFATLCALWVFVDTLNASEASLPRIKNVSILCAVLIWLTALLLVIQGGVGIFWFFARR